MNENNNIQQFDFLDTIAILAFILQVLDYELTLEQASNNDILSELRRDVKELRKENRELRRLMEEQRAFLQDIFRAVSGLQNLNPASAT